jgi:hypothetical protein
MSKPQNKKPVFKKSLAQKSCLISSAISCARVIPSSPCPECDLNSRMIEYKETQRNGKTGFSMKFCCNQKHTWIVTLFANGKSTYEGYFKHNGQTYDVVAEQTSKKVESA